MAPEDGFPGSPAGDAKAGVRTMPPPGVAGRGVPCGAPTRWHSVRNDPLDRRCWNEPKGRPDVLRDEDIKGRWLSKPAGAAMLQDVDGESGGDADGQD